MNSNAKFTNLCAAFILDKPDFFIKVGVRLNARHLLRRKYDEVLCKVLCHNICCLIQSIYELRIEPTFWSETNETSRS
ncbi:MAG: hypothetical protein QOJ02_3499 [Acidobacteriota bacterium]|nr:hypothetical protein [Acidobacteriota bacterium]